MITIQEFTDGLKKYRHMVNNPQNYYATRLEVVNKYCELLRDESPFNPDKTEYCILMASRSYNPFYKNPIDKGILPWL